MKNNGLKILLLLAMFMLNACGSVSTPAMPQQQITPAAALKYHPLDTRTGLPTIDVVLEAVASRDPQKLINLFGYISAACKTVTALGGPPPCRAGEAEGTIVEVLPSLGPEGSFLRKDETKNFPGLNVLGVYAVYQVSDKAYFEGDYPAGDYGIMLIGVDHGPGNTL